MSVSVFLHYKLLTIFIIFTCKLGEERQRGNLPSQRMKLKGPGSRRALTSKCKVTLRKIDESDIECVVQRSVDISGSPTNKATSKKNAKAKPRPTGARKNAAKAPKLKQKPKPLGGAAALAQLVANPKTIKERTRNAQILQAFNANHTDDIFEGESKLNLPDSGRSKPRSNNQVSC